MQTLSLSQFKRLTAVDYSHQHETIRVESFGKTVGYFVPPSIWLAKTGRDPELVILETVLTAIESGESIASEQISEWRRLAGVGE